MSSCNTSCYLSISLVTSFQPPPVGVHLVHRVHGDERLDTAHMNAKWFELMNYICYSLCALATVMRETIYERCTLTLSHATPIAVWEEGMCL